MTSQLAPNWTAIAATHASTQWVKRFLMTTLPQLQDQSLSAEEFAQALTEELETRNLITPAKQKNYRSNVCQALKSFDPNHPAIVLVSPTTEQYRELNDAQRGKLADRETKFFTSGQAEALVERAMGLLGSAEWSEVAAGLAVLIGRRISEILLSGFALKSQWSLSFSEMAKKQGAEGLTIEIPTLAPAQAVLTAIEKVQRNLKIEDLKAASLSPKMAKQKVNGRFSEAVASQCHEHFADLIPTRTDRETLYTHIFRAVYATIATHWFCPSSVLEHNFKAEIQGHFTLSQDGRKLPNYSARANYDDYAIADGKGNRDGRLGIKLEVLPGLQIIEAFRKPEANSEAQQSTQQVDPMDITTLSDGTRNALVFRATNLVAANTWAEMAIGLELLTGLRAEVLHTAEVAPISTYVLRVDEEEVETLVQQLQPTIARFQQLQPDTDQSGLQPVVDRTFDDLVKLHRDDLPQVYAVILQSRRQKGQKAEDAAPPQEAAIELSIPSQPIIPTPTTMPEPKPQIRQSRLYAPDVEKMTALMLRRGITPAEVFHAAIEVLESEQFQQQQTQTLSEVAQTMNWFTCKVEQLEATILHLQQERTQSQAQVGEAQAIAQLQSEKERLQQALEQTQSRLAAIEKLFGMEAIERLLGASPIQALGKQPQPEPRIAAVPRTTAHVSTEPKAAAAKPQRILGRRSREDATEEANQKVDALVEAIISWNNSQDDPHQQIRISHEPLRALGRLIGVNSQTRMQAGLERHQAEIDEMNSQLGLRTLHNRQVKGKQEILRSIARENLGLENWQEVEWS